MYILQSDTLILTEENIKDRIDYLQQVNPSGDLVIGTCGMAQLTFNVFDLNNIISDTDVTSKVFTYSKSKGKTVMSRWGDIPKDVVLMAINGDKKYCVYNALPYFKIVSAAAETTPPQPTEPITSIYIVDGNVYLGHGNAPYMSVYTLAGVKLADHTLTPVELTKVTAGQMLNRQGNVIKEYYFKCYDGNPIDYLESTSVYEQVGVFTANKPTRENDSNIRVVAHDNMCKFDYVVDNWVDSLTYPITAFDLLHCLCLRCGVSLATTSITNGDYLIGKKFDVDNTTGRNILQWICELSANFSYIDATGKLHVEFYKTTSKAFQPSNYKTIRKKEYTVAPIDKIQVKVQDNDIGVIVPADAPDKTNAYVIQNNPLMYTMSDTALRPYVTNIYNKLNAFTYIPVDFETVLDNSFSANVGDIVTIQSPTNELISTPIMVKHIVGDIEKYSSTGNPRREVQNDSANLAIKQLQGRTNQMVNTIDEFGVTLTEVKSATETNTTQLKLTQGEILLKVDADGIISAINLSKEEIKISADKVNITGFVTFSDLEGEGTTTINGSNIVTGYIVAEVIEASTTRLKYLSIGDKPSEDGFPTRLFPAGIRWADNSFLLTDNQEGVQMLTLATTGDMLELGAKYQVLASSDDEGNPMFMHMPNPAMKIYKDRVDFLKPTNLAWVGTQAEYDALTEEQKNYYTLMGVY